MYDAYFNIYCLWRRSVGGILRPVGGCIRPLIISLNVSSFSDLSNFVPSVT